MLSWKWWATRWNRAASPMGCIVSPRSQNDAYHIDLSAEALALHDAL